MARISVEQRVFTDVRFKLLAQKLDISNDEAISKCMRVWLNCYDQETYVLSKTEIDTISGIDGFCDAMIESKLAKKNRNRVYISGTKGRIEYVSRLRKLASKGGKANAETSMRNLSGQFSKSRQVIEKSQKSSKHMSKQVTSPLTLTLTPTLTLTKNNNKPPLPPTGGSSVLFEIWNKNCGELPRVLTMNAERIKKANARWKERPDETFWEAFCKYLSESEFHTGKNDRAWRANFDFFIAPNSFVKFEECRLAGMMR